MRRRRYVRVWWRRFRPCLGMEDQFITEMGLVESGTNAMTWMVGLTYQGPSQYLFQCRDFWNGKREASGLCHIRLAPASEG
jgi:hypothetical protein